jgi:calcium-dependent protein kinase
MRKDRKSCGSPYYMSPEIINGHFCPKTDVWAVGVILFLMITGKYPFDNEPRADIFENIVKKPVDVKLLKKSNCTNEAIDLIQKLLEKEIDDRLSASEALEHSWFDKFELNNNECFSLTMDTIETLRDFSNKTTFQKEVLFFIAKITEEDEIKKLRQMFEEMDTVNTGYLTKEEMKDAIESKKIKISHNDLERIWDGLDFHKTGKVNYTEFLAGMISGLMKDKEEKLQSAFNFFENTEDEGYISYSSLLQVIKSFYFCENNSLNVSKSIFLLFPSESWKIFSKFFVSAGKSKDLITCKRELYEI